jgi:hypothetical protein
MYKAEGELYLNDPHIHVDLFLTSYINSWKIKKHVEIVLRREQGEMIGGVNLLRYIVRIGVNVAIYPPQAPTCTTMIC